MIVSINQPAYLPWLGYFDRIARSDLHLVLDHVQFEKNSMANRNRILGANGSTMITVPVRTAGKFGDLSINDLLIDHARPWNKKHWNAISQSYGKARYFEGHRDWFERFYSCSWTHLSPLLHESTGYLLDALGIGTRIVKTSELNVAGSKSELVLNLCKEVGASTYLSGPFGRDYLDVVGFAEAGVKIEFQDYRHPVYQQLRGGFEPYMSVIDLLFNCGDSSLGILKNQ